MTEAVRLAGVELGGTKCVVVLARGREIVDQISLPTTTPEETLGQASAQLRAWQAEAPLAALGIAAFGPVHLDPARPGYGRLATTPKPDWADVDIIGALNAGLACPVRLDTDVNGAALAEHLWGVGLASLCYITIGTGVGGGLVIDGRPVHGALHPELGHMRVRRQAGDGFPGLCPFHGDCVEGLLSGPALAARSGLEGKDIPPDHPLWATVAGELAELVTAILLLTSVEAVLIGGGVGMGQPQLLPLLRRAVLDHLGGYLPHVSDATIDATIRQPLLGASAGPLGAVALARLALGNR